MFREQQGLWHVTRSADLLCFNVIVKWLMKKVVVSEVLEYPVLFEEFHWNFSRKRRNYVVETLSHIEICRVPICGAVNNKGCEAARLRRNTGHEIVHHIAQRGT